MLNVCCKFQSALGRSTKSYQFLFFAGRIIHVIFTLVEKVLSLYRVIKLLLKFRIQLIRLQYKPCSINERHGRVRFHRLGAHFKNQLLL